jgi:CHAT domain-containing protein/tetratricopeptide (TPR) repeat protein
VTEAEAVQLATRLTSSGRQAAAKELLLSVHANAADWPASLDGFNALILLARCYRAEHDFDRARDAIGRAIAQARSIGSPQAAAVAFEGAALIEVEDGRIHAAGEFFTASAKAEASVGNLKGRAAALSNYANMLTNHDLEGGEQLLREALRCVEPGGFDYFAFSDNLSSELFRQGRYDEAAEYCKTSVAGFLGGGNSYDAYLALLTLARVCAGAGRKEESADAYTRAHDLIRDLRRDEANDEHYARYAERVRKIEDSSREAVKNSPALQSDAFRQILREMPESVDPIDAVVGLYAINADKAQKKGFSELEAGQYSAAITSLFEARQAWQALGAVHMLVTIDYHLAMALTEIGDTERARPLLFRSFKAARELGDAFREGMCLSLLGRIAIGTGGRDRLDFLMSALALEPNARRQLGWPPDEDTPTDGGALLLQIANTCAGEGAYDLAEAYYEKALRIARDKPGMLGYRYVYRLANFLDMLRRSGRHDRVTVMLAELRTAATELPADPRIDRAVAAATAGAAYLSGERTQEVLDGLLAQCRAYEQERGQASGLDLTGFANAIQPPYQEAAQVSLALGDSALGLGLLERGAAQALREALATPGPDEGGDWAALPSIGSAVGITLFPAGRTITLLALDGADGSIRQSVVEDMSMADDGGPPLGKALRTFIDSTDSERRSHTSADALAPVLEHPAFRRLGEAVTELVPPGRTAWLVPHGYLHDAPLQLLPPRAHSYAVMPSLAIAASLPPSRPLTGAQLPPGSNTVVTCGDSLGDLPFARAETRLIAGEAGSAAVGGECTVEWLRTAVTASTSILHIACHGRFDRMRPSRSGLLLAAPPREQLAGTSAARLLTLPEVAQLPLDGITVVLSACSSGMETVRMGEPTGLVSAMLSAGAAAVVAAQWPIADLSAMLLMTLFYEKLAQRRQPADLLTALNAAAGDVRDMTATDLIDYGFQSADRLIALGGSQREADRVAGACLRSALTAIGDDANANAVAAVLAGEAGDGRLAALRALRPSQVSAARPWSDAAHWGAFKVVGRTTESSGLGRARPR